MKKTKKLTCIDCPKGCTLKIAIDSGKVLSVTGNQCKKGEAYAKQEIENPMRVLTTTVLAEGLSVKMVPVRTSGPIPKSKLLEAIEATRKIKISKSVKAEEVIQKNFMNLGVNLITTRKII
jgi:CxxC motif-containing protein